MEIIGEANSTIDNLWGKQETKKNQLYRIMTYVVRVDHDDKTLLHNVVTGKLVVLSLDEAKIINSLPLEYNSGMDSLIADHYLVPIDYDEHQQVVKLRHVLRNLYRLKKESITQYTILPTSACNARCYYCFEKGATISTMTEQTANDVIRFIDSHCGEDRKVSILWFGGEPTVGANRIDQICSGLKARNITFFSTMISNGYLFDDRMVEKAKNLWNLKYVQITIDGIEERYNRIKAYINAEGSPYQRVLRNVGLLLDKDIGVSLRQNFDEENYLDFKIVLDEIIERFGTNKSLLFYAYPVINEYSYFGHNALQKSKKDWIDKTSVLLNEISRDYGLNKKEEQLPFLRYLGCAADLASAITITPDGFLVKCAEQFNSDQMIGDVKQGFIDNEVSQSWKNLSDYPECNKCSFYPRCVRLSNCSAKDHCYFSNRNHLFIETIKKHYDLWSKKKQTEGGKNEIRRT